jgi:PAS domain S-box-containing protein
MTGTGKTKAQLQEALAQAQQRVAELEEALRESDERYRRIVELAPNGILTVDLKGCVVACNSAFLELTGFARDEIVGTHVSKFPTLRLQDIPRYTRLVLSAIRGTPIAPLDFQWIHKDGSTRWGEARIGLMKKGDKPTGLQVMVRDITERKRAEETLREREARMRSVFRAAPIGIGLVVDRVFLDVNDRICEMTGYTRAELIGESARILYPTDEDYEYVGREKYDQIAKRGTGAVETRFQHKEGRILDVLLSSTPLDPDDLSLGVTFTALDITARMQMEERLRRQERLAAVGQLASGIAHDFNNLLASIILYAQMPLGDPDLSPQTETALKTVLAESHRAADLIQQILDFARNAILETEWVDLGDLVQESLTFLRRALPENIRLVQDLGACACTIRADATRIQQALTNLVVNARDAMPDGGDLRIGVRSIDLRLEEPPPVQDMEPGCWVCLTVADTGTGMSPDVRAHLFEPFFTTKGPGKGTGLGLAQVFGIVKQHEGHIKVDTAVGEGTTFTLYLPAAQAGMSEAASSRQVTSPEGRGETLLVVEDAAPLLLGIKEGLESLGYHVLTAANGREALEIAVRRPVDLVLTDLVMPEMGGKALLDRLRDRSLQPAAIAMTGHITSMDADALKDAGFNAVLAKPFAIEALATLVRNTLDHPEVYA